FDRQKLPQATSACVKLLQDGDGLDKAFKVIKSSLPEKLRETAYALACDVAAADGKVTPEESRILELIRHHLQIGRLPAAAIERGSPARHMHLSLVDPASEKRKGRARRRGPSHTLPADR